MLLRSDTDKENMYIVLSGSVSVHVKRRNFKKGAEEPAAAAGTATPNLTARGGGGGGRAMPSSPGHMHLGAPFARPGDMSARARTPDTSRSDSHATGNSTARLASMQEHDFGRTPRLPFSARDSQQPQQQNKPGMGMQTPQTSRPGTGGVALFRAPLQKAVESEYEVDCYSLPDEKVQMLR